MSNSMTRRLIGSLGITLSLMAAFFALSAVQPAQAQQASTLEGAMRAYIQSQGETYAGPCSEADITEDAGKWCSEIRSQSGNTAEVAFGPAFSEFVETVTFQQFNGDWYVGNSNFTAPSNVSATTFDSFVQIAWSRGTNNNFYCIDTAFNRSDLLTISGSWSNWGCGTTGTAYNLTNLACDRIHYFRVWAAGPGDAGYSNFGTFRSQDCVFTEPANPRSDNVTKDSARLIWDRGANNYWFCADLARSRSDLVNLTGTWFNTGCGTTSPVVDVAGLSCDTTYFWRAWATGPDASGYTPVATFETGDCIAGNQPVTITGTSTPQNPALLTGVRIGAHAPEGFDRIVFEFANGLPSETTIQYQANATQCGSGQPQSLEGAGTLTVRMADSQAHNNQGQTTVDSTAVDGTSGAILEAIQVCDFEGIVEWAVGTDEIANFQVVTLANPDRIVIDVRR